MAYADFEFYLNSYGGTAISADDFLKLSNMASMYIDTATMGRAKRATGDCMESVKMAMCALAEIFQDEENVNAANFSEDALLSGLSSEAVGSWSIGYKTRAASTVDADVLDRRKRDTLAMYLGQTGLLRAVGYHAKGCCGC